MRQHDPGACGGAGESVGNDCGDSFQPVSSQAILRVLEDCPEELAELRATLLQEHVWRQREGV